jgi:hypothetical protein
MKVDKVGSTGNLNAAFRLGQHNTEGRSDGKPDSERQNTVATDYREDFFWMVRTIENVTQMIVLITQTIGSVTETIVWMTTTNWKRHTDD